MLLLHLFLGLCSFIRGLHQLRFPPSQLIIFFFTCTSSFLALCCSILSIHLPPFRLVLPSPFITTGVFNLLSLVLWLQRWRLFIRYSIVVVGKGRGGVGNGYGGSSGVVCYGLHYPIPWPSPPVPAGRHTPSSSSFTLTIINHHISRTLVFLLVTLPLIVIVLFHSSRCNYCIRPPSPIFHHQHLFCLDGLA